jgi:hypothetical protein
MSAAHDAEAEWTTLEKVDALRAALGHDAARPPSSEDDSTLRRFLIAQRGDVAGATAMLQRHERWRREDTPWWPGVPPLALLEPCVQLRSAYVHGHDRGGRPMFFILAGNHRASVDRKSLYAFVAFIIDEAVRRSLDAGAGGAFTGVVDMTGFGYSSFDTDALRYILLMLSRNYPER